MSPRKAVNTFSNAEHRWATLQCSVIPTNCGHTLDTSRVSILLFQRQPARPEGNGHLPRKVKSKCSRKMASLRGGHM